MIDFTIFDTCMRIRDDFELDQPGATIDGVRYVYMYGNASRAMYRCSQHGEPCGYCIVMVDRGFDAAIHCDDLRQAVETYLSM